MLRQKKDVLIRSASEVWEYEKEVAKTEQGGRVSGYFVDGTHPLCPQCIEDREEAHTVFVDCEVEGRPTSCEGCGRYFNETVIIHRERHPELYWRVQLSSPVSFGDNNGEGYIEYIKDNSFVLEYTSGDSEGIQTNLNAQEIDRLDRDKPEGFEWF